MSSRHTVSPSMSRYRTPHRSGRPYSSSKVHTRFYTPDASTPSKAVVADNDRFIPSRRNLNIDLCRRALVKSGEKKRARNDQREGGEDDPSPTRPTEETPLQKEFKRRMLSSLCNIPLEKLNEEGEPVGLLSFGAPRQERSLVREGSAVAQGLENPFAHDTLRTMKLGDTNMDAVAQLSVAKKVVRKVPGAPVRILDAPDIVDDYYLNLISWGKDNILAVGLAQSVYLWNATTGEIQHLITVDQPNDYITSVSWCPIPGHTRYIAVGTNASTVHLFDGQALRKVRTLTGHNGRVSSLAWNQHWLTSGARDSYIINHDVRSADPVVSKYRGHEQEVCGLKWNEEGNCLASGGNENYLCLWDAAMSGQGSFHQRRRNDDNEPLIQSPRIVLKHHKAAVKALDWCPFHRGLLASGGGTADRTVKFWNSSSGAILNSIDTGSQVCSIVWSKHQRELCTSHGYSENQLILWRYPSMTKIKELTGHTARVLNMEMSPDGASVVSAAADETLRFWNIFGSPSAYRRTSSGMPLAGDLSFGVPAIR